MQKKLNKINKRLAELFVFVYMINLNILSPHFIVHCLYDNFINSFVKYLLQQMFTRLSNRESTVLYPQIKSVLP